MGGFVDNNGIGAAWVFTRGGNGVWMQQGGKLVGTGAANGQYGAWQGYSVAISADGDTAMLGGPIDDDGVGAVWVFARSKSGVWTQQGGKLVGVGADNSNFGARQGTSVALSADGNTAIEGGWNDEKEGAAWVFTRGKSGAWTQQGAKLVGSGAIQAVQGFSVALSADGNTAISGGPYDSRWTGAMWVFTRGKDGVWTQQGGKLVGAGGEEADNGIEQGYSVALSADGDTAIVGGLDDNSTVGAAWVFTRGATGIWTQQGAKLVGAGALYSSLQGSSVSLSADGDTALVGGPKDKVGTGATWVFTRRGGVWTQQGAKLVGAGAVRGSSGAYQGSSVSLSGDGDTAIEGGLSDNNGIGAAWVFLQPLQVNPYPAVSPSGPKGGPFSPASFSYTLGATSGSVKYAITRLPGWLTASSRSGTVTTTGKTITFTINSSADKMEPGVYAGAIAFQNADNVQMSVSRAVTLTVEAK